MAFDLVAGIMLAILSLLLHWAVSLYRKLSNGGKKESSSFSIFKSYTVEWGWTEPMQVGETMTFKVKFFGVAGTPRDASEVENLKIEIVRNSLTIAHVEEIENEANAVEESSDSNRNTHSNEVKVSFTVRASGVYTINIYENDHHVAGSPIEKTFIPGPPVANRTTLIRTLNSSTVMAITQNKPHVLAIEPRDEYGNNCATRVHYGDLRDNFTFLVTEIGEEGNPIPVSTDLHLSRENISVDLYVPTAGCFHAAATFSNEVIGNGEFDLVVLTPREMAEVDENLDKRNLNVYYEAKLISSSLDNYSQEKLERSLTSSRALSMGDMPSTSGRFSAFKSRRLSHSGSHSKAKIVYCYITSKQLVIKEFFLRFIPKRLQSFRLCQATQVSIFSPGTSSNPTEIMISDNCQPSYILACPKSNVLIATFVGILNRNIGGSDTFEEKLKYFRQELLSHHKVGKFSRGKVFLSVERENLLHDSYKYTKGFTSKEWCRLFQVNFEGEMGVDWGGLCREWISLLCKQLFVPNSDPESEAAGDSRKDPADLCLFRSLKNDNQALVLPNQHHTSGNKLKMFEFAGKLVGKCLLDGAFERDQIKYVTARFARSFLAQIIGLAVTFKHFESDDPELFKSKIRYIMENDVSDFDLCFAEEEYQDNGKLLQVVPLKANGAKIKVTNDNKLEYLNRLAQYRLSNAVKQEIEAFNRGINLLIPEHLLSMFDENELELAMCGSSKISVSDMRKNVILNDFSPPFIKTMDWFWAVVSSFTQEELAMLLQFVTGCSQLPPGGFGEMSPRFKISFLFYHTNNLPTAHTCFNELCLPVYDSYDRLHKMLKLAIKEGAVGFGMI